MPARISKNEFAQRFKNANRQELSVDLDTYVAFKKQCMFIDSIYGEWWAIPGNVINLGCSHPERALEKTRKPKIKINEVKMRIKKIYGDTVEIDEKTYNGVCKTCRFIDKKYGEFFTSPGHIFNGHGHRKRGIIKYSKTRSKNIENIIEDLYSVHGDLITIKPKSYTSTGKMATFIHKIHGEWDATPNNIIGKKAGHMNDSVSKSKKTFLKKYGVDHPNKILSMFLKGQRSRWDTVNLEHWKTGKSILCRASYEYAIVSKLNNERIDYDWQIKFNLNHDTVYFCDLFLIDKNIYVEIKGFFFRERSRAKWELFHLQHENSELWMKKEVVKFTGKSTYRMKKEFEETLCEQKS